MGNQRLVPLRQELLSQASGVTLEVGFGSGANLPFYSDRVTRLVGVEKEPAIARLSKGKRLRVDWEVKIGVAEKLPVETRSVDCVVTTLTICSCADVFKTLQEIRRVLKPGGQYLFLEHGLSHDPNIQRWQRRLTPLQKKLGCGCRLDRNIRGLLADACLEPSEVRSFYMEKTPKVAGYMTIGRISL